MVQFNWSIQWEQGTYETYKKIGHILKVTKQLFSKQREDEKVKSHTQKDSQKTGETVVKTEEAE